MDLFKILYPFEWAVSWIMYLIHKGLTFVGFSDGSGPAWVVSIIGLVIVIRIILIPLFFRQIKASRGMQLLQPEMQAIQKKYKGKTDPASREAMTRETMALYKKHGTNPFSSCLPILAQSPIFFALFRVLRALQPISTGKQDAIGPLDQHVASDVESSTVFGAKLSDIFLQVDSTQSKIVIVCLIVLMCATTFFTQRQLTMKNMPPSALVGPMASTQKMILYLYPVIFAISGVNFPVGVLVYWSTTNIWSMGQQFYTIRRMPAPGSEAERHLKERQARKAARHGGDEIAGSATSVIEEAKGGQRVQPKRQSRSARKSGASGPSSTEKRSDKKVASEGRTSEDDAPERASDAASLSDPVDGATADEPSVLESATSKGKARGAGAKGSTPSAGRAAGKGATSSAGRGAVKSSAGARQGSGATASGGAPKKAGSAGGKKPGSSNPTKASGQSTGKSGGKTSGGTSRGQGSGGRPSGGSAIKKGGQKAGGRKGSTGGQSTKKSK